LPPNLIRAGQRPGAGSTPLARDTRFRLSAICTWDLPASSARTTRSDPPRPNSSCPSPLPSGPPGGRRSAWTASRTHRTTAHPSSRWGITWRTRVRNCVTNTRPDLGNYMTADRSLGVSIPAGMPFTVDHLGW